MRKATGLSRTAVTIVLMVCLSSGMPVRGEELDQDKLLKAKAALVYKFTKFVRWPDDVFESKDSPFVMGVIGQDPFGQTLDDTVKDRQIHDRSVEIHRLNWIEPNDRKSAEKCHVLFICESEKQRLAEILEALRDRPILLVSDTRDFAQKGGMIGIVLDKGRLRFEINEDVMERAKVQPHGKLLNLATVVESDG
jgi:hypothetical protein